MKVYIAGPFFTEQERDALRHMICLYREANPEDELFIPMEHSIANGEDMPNEVWAKKVFDMDVQAIRDCDVVLVMYTGHYSDTGTAWELGFAHGLRIPIIGYIPPWAETKDMSLMVLNCFDGYLGCNGEIVVLSSIITNYNQK